MNNLLLLLLLVLLRCLPCACGVALPVLLALLPSCLLCLPAAAAAADGIAFGVGLLWRGLCGAGPIGGAGSFFEGRRRRCRSRPPPRRGDGRRCRSTRPGLGRGQSCVALARHCCCRMALPWSLFTNAPPVPPAILPVPPPKTHAAPVW